MPNNDIPKLGFLDAIHFDKWVHAGLFGMLTILLSWPFRKLFPARHSIFLSIAITALLYGITMEYVQKYLTTDRDFDYADMIADGVGCLIGYFAIRFLITKVWAKNKPL